MGVLWKSYRTVLSLMRVFSIMHFQNWCHTKVLWVSYESLMETIWAAKKSSLFTAAISVFCIPTSEKFVVRKYRFHWG